MKLNLKIKKLILITIFSAQSLLVAKPVKKINYDPINTFFGLCLTTICIKRIIAHVNNRTEPNFWPLLFTTGLGYFGAKALYKELNTKRLYLNI